MLNLILFLSEIPFIFSPEIKKNSFIISILVALLACMRFVGIIGLKNERKWGMEFLISVGGLMTASLLTIKNMGGYLVSEIIMLTLCILVGVFTYGNLKKGI